MQLLQNMLFVIIQLYSVFTLLICVMNGTVNKWLFIDQVLQKHSVEYLSDSCGAPQRSLLDVLVPGRPEAQNTAGKRAVRNSRFISTANPTNRTENNPFTERETPCIAKNKLISTTHISLVDFKSCPGFLVWTAVFLASSSLSSVPVLFFRLWTETGRVTWRPSSRDTFSRVISGKLSMRVAILNASWASLKMCDEEWIFFWMDSNTVSSLRPSPAGSYTKQKWEYFLWNDHHISIKKIYTIITIHNNKLYQ